MARCILILSLLASGCATNDTPAADELPEINFKFESL